MLQATNSLQKVGPVKNRLKLTSTAVEKLQFPEGAVTKNGKAITHFIFWDTEIKGFGVRLSVNSKTKTYVLQHRVKGAKQERNMSLGRHGQPVLLPDGKLRRHAFGADDARTEALGKLAHLLKGVDPIAEAKRKKEDDERQAALNKARSTSLKEVMEHYLEHKRTKHGPLRPATKESIRRTCETELLSWMDKPIASVTRDGCLAKFTEISQRAPSVGNQTMIYLRALCNHAREMHATDDGNFTILAINPVTRLFKLRKPNPEKPRDRRVPLGKVGAVFSMLRQRHAEARNVIERTACDWISFVLLTGCRLTESGSLKWSDVDLEAKTFTLRGDVVKNHNSVTLPMSTVLHEILSARKDQSLPDDKILRRRVTPTISEYVFPSWGRKKPFMTDARATMDAVSAAAGLHVSPHDLRRTAEDIAKACKVDPDERRQLLNHLASDVHGMSYANNPDPKVLAPAVESIAKFITSAAKVAEAMQSGANVLAFPGKPA